MRTGLGTAALAAIATTMAGGADADARSRPARDGDIAIQEELVVARKKATLAAYDLFIARHPQHRLAKIARAERAKVAAARSR